MRVFFLGGGGGVIVGAVYGHWFYSRMFLHNFGSVFQFACPPLVNSHGYRYSVQPLFVNSVGDCSSII